MRTLTDGILSAVGQISAKLGPLTSLMDSFVERLAPQATAQACTGIFCTSSCVRCSNGHLGEVSLYANTVSGCTFGNYSCGVQTCTGC
jgi:hypothetical protein